MAMKLLAVFLGGAFGSLSRFAVYLLVENKLHIQKFWATMSVNLFGSLLIGVVWAILSGYKNATTWQLLLMTGFLGGFTTFSAFSLDVLELFRAGQLKQALLYIAISLIGSLLMVFCAYYLVKWVRG
jgi:CrcB protein